MSTQIHGTPLNSLALQQLDGANLSGLSLRDTDFTDASLGGANLSGADLSGSILWDANLCGAVLSGAQLERTFLAGARYNQGTVFPEGFSPNDAGMQRVD